MNEGVTARYVIWSHTVSAETIARLTEVAPDATVTKGDELHPERPVGRIARDHKWEIHSALPRSADAEEHIKSLLARLAGLAEIIRGIDGDGQMTIARYFRAEAGAPGFYLSAETIEQLADIGASVDIDDYVI